MAHEIKAQCGQTLKVYDKADRPKWESIPQYEFWIRELERTPCESCGNKQDGRKTLRSN